MNPAVVLFAREPEAGRVKTRLASDLGEETALALYEAFLDDLARPGLLAPGWQGVVAHPGARPGPGLLRRFAAGFRFRTQGNGSLGERLWRVLAAERAFGNGPVAVAGSDVPTLSQDLLAEGLSSVGDRAAVAFSPAPDGGFSLLVLGPRADPGFLLGRVRWSTGFALADAAANAAAQGLEVVFLPELADVDRAADLDALALSAADGRAPRTLAVLRSLGGA